MTSSASSAEGILTIQLEDARNVNICFEVEPTSSLRALFVKYAQLKGLSLDALRFTFGDAVVRPEDSPDSLGMGDDGTIRVSLTGEALTKETIAHACMTGSIPTAVQLLSENRELCRQSLSWFDSDGQELSTPPLYIAIDYGHVDLVSQLLPLHGGIIDTLRNDDDYSPLQWAAWTGDLDIIKALVKEGEAQVDEEALSLAREHGHQKVAEFLLTHVDLYAGLVDETDIMDKACREGDIAKVRQLLEGADIDQWKDEEGRFLACSPVHLAMRHGHMELIQLFAEKGMRVDINDEAPAAAESNPPNH